jgi:hypothetical protein
MSPQSEKSDSELPAVIPVEQLQFRHAEPAGEAAPKRCSACNSPIWSTYFQVVGRDICPTCAERIRLGQQAPPAHSLLKAALYGGGAALAGCILYATIAIVANLELALIAILIGFMVGKAIRHASNGLGGRPQQLLAVVLTYFAITFSYVGVYIYQIAQKPQTAQQRTAEQTNQPRPGIVTVIVAIVGIAAVAPFLALTGPNPVGALISLVIIFFGLQRAWRMTGRINIDIFGPYDASAVA